VAGQSARTLRNLPGSVKLLISPLAPNPTTPYVMDTGRRVETRSFEANQRKGNDVAVNQITVEPAGFSGWHSHPGTTVVAVQSGQITLFSERIAGGKCRVRTFTAGQVFLEHPSTKYNAVNTGGEPYVIAATFFNVPHGGPSRIDQTDPGNC
jgi:quercetin dioxygenase-like cupin family protein